MGTILVPALIAVHVGIHHLTVDLFAVAVDRIDHLTPYVDILLLTAQQQRIAEARQAEMVRVSAGHSSRLRHFHRKSPSVASPIPLAVAGAADRSIQANISRDNAVVLQRALTPGLSVF